MDTVRIIRNEQFVGVAQGILGMAKKRVDICTYKFEISKRTAARPLNTLIDGLYNLALNNVKIRVLLNTTSARTGLTKINQCTARDLTKRGIECRTFIDGRCQHAKSLVVDDSIGIIGSHNWSPRSMVANNESAVVLYGQDYWREHQEHFEKLWEYAKEIK